VIKLIIKRLKGLFDIGEVDDPSEGRIDRSRHIDPRTEGMAMKASALVPGRNVREPVCGLKGEFFVDLHDEPQGMARIL
jgi:hypothetical protein